MSKRIKSADERAPSIDVDVLQAFADRALRNLEVAHGHAVEALLRLRQARFARESAALDDLQTRIAEMKAINRSG